jgi:hypothetical protein
MYQNLEYSYLRYKTNARQELQDLTTFKKEKREDNQTLESFLLGLVVKVCKEASNIKVLSLETLEEPRTEVCTTSKSHIHK